MELNLKNADAFMRLISNQFIRGSCWNRL